MEFGINFESLEFVKTFRGFVVLFGWGLHFSFFSRTCSSFFNTSIFKRLQYRYICVRLFRCVPFPASFYMRNYSPPFLVGFVFFRHNFFTLLLSLISYFYLFRAATQVYNLFSFSPCISSLFLRLLCTFCRSIVRNLGFEEEITRTKIHKKKRSKKTLQRVQTNNSNIRETLKWRHNFEFTINTT